MTPQANTLSKLLETRQLAHKLMTEYGLIEQGWTFQFSNKKTALGTCSYDDKTIVFSKHFLASSMDSIEDTIRHEIAHALVGPNHGHDHVWRMKCIEIGANPMRTAQHGDGHAFNGNYNYLLICESCESRDGKTRRWRRHRMKQSMWSAECPYCNEPLTIVDLRDGGVYGGNR